MGAEQIGNSWPPLSPPCPNAAGEPFPSGPPKVVGPLVGGGEGQQRPASCSSSWATHPEILSPKIPSPKIPAPFYS